MANRVSNIFKNSSNTVIALSLVFIFVMLIVPFPAPIIDFMMIINLALGFIVLLTVIYTPKSSSISSFPRIILFLTIFGIGLNIRSTVYILSNGYTGIEKFDAQMIKAFANVVAGGNLTLGIVVFIILILFQVLVVTKGATRVTEVAARFALDSMNSKMFAVDSELNSGSITEEQAREKKALIQQESDFFATMDGASKFVSGNVKFGIVVTCVNLIAGILYSMIVKKMSFSGALGTFPMLTIGDGLLSQIPSMLLSISTGLLVTGSSSKEVIGEQVKKEFAVNGNIYMITGGGLLFMGLTFMLLGGSASLFFLLSVVGGGVLFIGYRMQRSEKMQIAAQQAAAANSGSNEQKGHNPREVPVVNPPDPLSLELGIALVELVDKQKGAELLERVTRIRTEAALELGLVVPSIRIIDNLSLDPQEYCFKINGIEEGKSKLKLGHYMCINTGIVTEEIKGEPTKDPAFGVPAIWITEDQRLEAERAGYSVIDPPTIIATHMTEIIKAKAAKILSRQEVSAIINKISETNKVVVDEVITTYKYTYGEIEKILQGLLQEQVSIRNIVAILETLANYGMYTPHNTSFLIEKVREELGLQICTQYVNPEDKKLSVLRLSDEWSDLITQYTVNSPNGGKSYVGFPLEIGRKWISNVNASLAVLRERNYLPIILCKSEIRALVRESLEREIPGTIVLSYNEVLAAGNSINLEILGEISE